MLNKIIKKFSSYLEERNVLNNFNGEDIVFSKETKEEIIKILNMYCPELLHTKLSHLLIDDIPPNLNSISNKQILLLTKVIKKYNVSEVSQKEPDENKCYYYLSKLYESIHNDKIKSLEKSISNVANLSSLLIIAKLNPSTLKEERKILLDKAIELNKNIQEELKIISQEVYNVSEFSVDFQRAFKSINEALIKLDTYEENLQNSQKIKIA